MPPENSERGGNDPSAFRYNDDRQRLADRLYALERDRDLTKQEVADLRGQVISMRANIEKHIDASIDEARRGVERQEAVLQAMHEIKSDVRVLKEQRGTISIGTILQVAGVLCAVAGVFFTFAKIGSG